MAIETNLLEFWHRKEQELGQRLSVAEVAKACGLNEHTVDRLLKGKTRQFQEHVLNKVCEFLECEDGPVPFVIYRRDDET